MAKAAKYEGSREDNAKDAKAAKKAGMSRAKFEKSATDRKMDRAGQKKLDAKAKRKKAK